MNSSPQGRKWTPDGGASAAAQYTTNSELTGENQNPKTEEAHPAFRVDVAPDRHACVEPIPAPRTAREPQKLISIA
jgi:hypothetical protein